MSPSDNGEVVILVLTPEEAQELKKQSFRLPGPLFQSIYEYLHTVLPKQPLESKNKGY